MNASPSTHSRFVCKLARALGWRHRHVTTCADCQEFFTAAAGLDAALRHEARSGAVLPSGRLNDRIIDTVRAVSLQPRRSAMPAAWLSFGGVAAGVLGAVLLFRNSPSSTDENANLETDVRTVVSTAESLSQRFLNSLEPSALALAENNPLRDEIDSVYSDAQSALSFLALNFLPAVKESPATNPPNTATQSG